MGLLFIVLSFIFLSPLPSRAQVNFGGFAVSVTFCTCQYTAAAYPYMITFTPLFVGGVRITGMTGIAVPTALLFRNYTIHPGAWSKGFLIPGLQACWQNATIGCKPQGGQYGAIVPPFAGFAGSSP